MASRIALTQPATRAATGIGGVALAGIVEAQGRTARSREFAGQGPPGPVGRHLLEPVRAAQDHAAPTGRGMEPAEQAVEGHRSRLVRPGESRDRASLVPDAHRHGTGSQCGGVRSSLNRHDRIPRSRCC